MDEFDNTRESIKNIKNYDQFLTTTKINLTNNNQANEEGNQFLNQILSTINTLIPNLKQKNKIINELKQENKELNEIKLQYEQYKINNKIESDNFNEMKWSINNLEDKIQDLIKDNDELITNRDELLKENDYLTNNYNDILTKYEELSKAFDDDYNDTKEKNKNLEEQNLYFHENEKKLKQKIDWVLQEKENIKEDLCNKLIKMDQIETRLKENFNLEKSFLELQCNYDNLLKENKSLTNNYNQKMFFKNEECKSNKEQKDEVYRQNIRYEHLIKEKEYQEEDLKDQIKELNLNLQISIKESEKRDEIVLEKQNKLDFLNNEINDMNIKLLEFGDIMEKVINENQYLKLKIKEINKNEDHLRSYTSEYNKFKSTYREKRNDEFNKINTHLKDINYY